MRRIAVGIAVLSAMSVLSGCAQQILGSSAEERVEKTVPMPAGGTFALDNINGSITLTVGKPGEVHIVAIKRVQAFSEEKAKEGLAKLEVQVEGTGKGVSVETRYPKSAGFLAGVGFSGAVTFDVAVPEGTAAKLTTVNGTITADAPASAINCETTNGKVNALSCGRIDAAVVNGTIQFKAQNAGEVTTTNGSIEGQILSRSPEKAHLETVNGSIALALSPDAALHLSAENVNGGVSTEIPGLSESKHELFGDLNGGGQTVSVETVNGSIHIRPIR